jgi:hypothetical protein
LSGLDTFWGFKYYNQYVVADLENSILVDATVNYKNNPAFTQDIIQFNLNKTNFNPTIPVTKNLQTLFMSSVSVILPESDQVVFKPLLVSGKESELMPISVVYDGLNPRQILSYFKPDDNPKVLAAEIFGPSPENPFHMIAVGDTDFIYDAFWTSSRTILDQTYFTPLFNNADFLLNSLDYLSGETNLLGLRGKNIRQRPFSDIEMQRKLDLLSFKIKEEEIFEKIDDTKKGLEEIINKRTFENREIFTADELAIIGNIRKKLDQLRAELAQIRLQTNADTQRVETIVKLINIFAVPSFICLIWLLCLLFSHSKNRSKTKMHFDADLAKLSLFGLVVLLLGCLSVYYANRSDIQAYEDHLLFPDLSKKINDVHQIVIKNHTGQLTFVNDQGEWKLQNGIGLPVYQDRIRHFLRTLMSGRFYEKKSDKAQNLYLFGLQPVETEGSPNIRLELLNDKNELLESLEVGTYNLDLGRGSKAAYVKFDNLFQVWLAEIDFIDLTPNPDEWTYSTIWNLRFGRLVACQNVTRPDKLSNLARELLNTHFLEVADNLSEPKLLRDLELKTEYVDKIHLRFYESDGNIWLEYVFPTDMSQDQLQIFSKYVTKRFLKIDPQQWEKIKYVTNFEQTGSRSSQKSSDNR